MRRLVLAAALALGLAACPAEEPVDEPAPAPDEEVEISMDVIAEAARTTLEAGTARASLTLGRQVPLLPAAPGPAPDPDDESVEADPGTPLIVPGLIGQEGTRSSPRRTSTRSGAA